MARLPRMVLPGIPHHVTQRGNRRERTFFGDADYALYLDLPAQSAARHGVEVLAEGKSCQIAVIAPYG